MTTWLLLAAAILAEVTATLSLRGALDLPALYVVVVVGYVLTFALLAQVLAKQAAAEAAKPRKAPQQKAPGSAEPVEINPDQI